MSRRISNWCREMQARVDYLDEDRNPLTGARRRDRRFVRVRGAGSVVVARIDPAARFPVRTRGVPADEAPLVIDDVEYWFGARAGKVVPLVSTGGDHVGVMLWRGITSTPEVDVSLEGDRELDPSRALIRPGDLGALVAGACDFSHQAERAQPLWAWFLSNLGP